MAVNKRKFNFKLPHTHSLTYLHSTKTTTFIYVSACWDVRCGFVEILIIVIAKLRWFITILSNLLSIQTCNNKCTHSN
jgi:hypothetical protein